MFSKKMPTFVQTHKKTICYEENIDDFTDGFDGWPQCGCDRL